MQDRQKIHLISAWESSRGFKDSAIALVKVLAGILFRPAEVLKGATHSSGLDLKTRFIRAFVFASILGYIKLIFEVIYSYWNQASFSLGQPVYFSLQSLFSPFFIFRPIVILFFSFILIAAGVKLILGFDKFLAPVFLIACYKSAADIFFLLPMFGGFLALFWSAGIIAIGIREFYRISFWRSALASVVAPLLLFLFLLLSLGPNLLNLVALFYPETSAQMAKVNEISAYLYTSEIVSATETYKKDLGFYPTYLGALDKYLPDTLIEEITSPDSVLGFEYIYNCPDKDHFTLEVKSKRDDYGPTVSFYADQSGKVRLGGPEGREVESLKQFESLVLGTLDKSAQVKGKIKEDITH